MKHQKRKDRIKNIAIIFLVIMLLLTFFSNTIMNYSLSEVGTAYASSGSLTTKIRGDGYVSAKDPLEVKTDKTSEVLKVLVKNGDTVKKGDTLFVLEGASAADLKQAQSDLLSLNYDYEKALLEISVPDYGKNNMEIKYARKELKQALQNIEDTKKSMKKKEKEYEELKTQADKAKTKADKAKEKADKKKDKVDKVQEKINAQEIKVNDKAAEISQLDITLESYESEKTALSGESNDDILEKQAAVTQAERAVEDAKSNESQYESDRTSSVIAAEIKEKKKTIADLQKELEDLKEKQTEAQNATADDTETTSITRSIRNKKTEISDVNAEISSINSEISSINAQITSVKSQITSKTEEYKKEEDEEKKEKIQTDIETLQGTLTDLQNSLKEQKNSLGTQQKSLAALQQELSDLQQDLTKAQQKANAEVSTQLKQAKKNVTDKEAEITTANQELSDLQTEKTAADERETKLKEAQAVTASYEKVLTAAKRSLEDAQSALTKDNSTGTKEIDAKIKEAKAEKTKLEKEKATLESKKTELENKKTTLETKKTELDTTYSDLLTAYQEAKAKVDSFQQADETTLDTVNQAAEEKRKALETLYLDLASTQKDDALKQQLSELDSDQKEELIEQKKKEIKKLQKQKKPVKIKAGSAGIIQSLSIKVGDTTTADTALAEIQLKKNGYQLSIPVTIDQSKMVKRGDNASVLNIWDDSIKAVLSEIKTDTENPNSGRTLVFDISGDVENGTSLSIAVGERTANYDLIVPTSAIREDSDGKFVLVIEEKSSPVGNRYIARKEAVSVITQDETQSAVSGSFDSYTSIITTASKSVEPGDYVRLAS